MTPSRIALLLAVPALALGVAQARADGAGKWSERAHLPEARGELAAAALDGKLYAVGGTTATEAAATLVEEYDPATDTWRARAPLPRGLSHAGVAAMNHKLYAAGGFTANVHAGALDVAFEYDPASDAWRALAPLSRPRGSVALAALDGKLYAVGGRGLDKVTVGTNEMYDPATGRWSLRAPLARPRDHMGLVALDGRLHALGGRFDTPRDNTDLHEVYDPATDRWTPAPPLPTARSSVAVALYRGLILVAGGECDRGHTFVENEGYDRQSGKWQALAAMAPKGRHGFRGDTIGGAAYFPGGAADCGGGGLTDTLLVFSLP